jgi:opacity protein-like surface antigen
MNPTHARRFIGLLLTAGLLSQANAADLRFHVEADAGLSEVGDADDVSIDDTATAFRFGTGYRFTDWLRIDGAYVNLGTFEASPELAPGAPVALEASADGFEVLAVGRIPVVGELSATLQAGILWWSSEITIDGSRENDSGNDLAWGLGLEYAFRPSLQVTGGWRRYDVDGVDVDALWLGLMLRFGDAQ